MSDPDTSSIDDPVAATTPQLRLATPADLDALISIENATFSSDRLSPRQWRHHLLNPNAAIIVASNRGGLVAAAVLFFRKPSRFARLYSIAVSTEMRGQGLGERLLDACETAASERGCVSLRLEVREDNESAKRLYARRGYRLFGRRDNYYEDGADALRYEKSLPHS